MIIKRERVKEIVRSRDIKLIDLVIILNNDCNADCPLCVAKQVIKNKTCKELCTGYNAKCKRCCDRTADDDEFYLAVKDILSTVSGQNVRIILSGGEPTLSSRLIPVLEILDEYTFSSLNIETNGAWLLNEKVSEELLKRHINIILSRYGITDEKNNSIFNFKYDMITEESVKSIMEKYKGYVTVSCIPLKGCVDSGAKLIEYYEYFNALGASNVTFTEAMFDTTLEATNKNISVFCNENTVKIDTLSDELKILGVPLIFDSGGSFRVIRHRYVGGEITLMAADMSKIAYENQNNDTYTKYLIYPSGEIGAHSIENR